MDAVINAMRLGLVEMDLGTYLMVYLASYMILFIKHLIIYNLGGYVTALHSSKVQTHDQKLDQTGSEIYILNRGTGVYRCFTQLPDARTKVQST
jgi:hypothetical protein